MIRRTALTLVVVALVAFAGCSALSNSGDSTAVPTMNDSNDGTAVATDGATATEVEATTAATATSSQTTTATAIPTTSASTGTTAASTATAAATATVTQTATATAVSTATATATPTPTATETPTPTTTETETPTPTETETATETETETETPTATETATATATATETETETPTASAVGPDTPLDARSVADAHESALDEAGSFTVNESSTLADPSAESPETDSSGARVDLDDDTALQVSRPTEEATRYTYAEGSTAYERNVLSGDAAYETEELGRPLAGSLTGSSQVYETLQAVDYERAGTVTRDDTELAVYVANGTDSVDTSGALYNGEDVTAFNSTLVLDPETGVVRSLETARTTDYLSSGEPVTIETSRQFSAVGDTDVDQPEWVDDLIDD